MWRRERIMRDKWMDFSAAITILVDPIVTPSFSGSCSGSSMALFIHSGKTDPSALRSLSSLRSSHNMNIVSSRIAPPWIASTAGSRRFAISQKLNDPSDDSKISGAKKRLSEQSSWETEDSKGNDYLYRLGAEADNTNIAVGARPGSVDDLFTGSFLGRDSDIVFDYRQKVTRSFEYLQGDYYIAPVFLDKVVCHIVKNYIAHLLNTKVPLILGIWGGKGQGKSFQTELIFQAMGIEPVIMSAGELESEKAGEPGRLIRERYRAASQVVQNQVRS